VGVRAESKAILGKWITPEKETSIKEEGSYYTTHKSKKGREIYHYCGPNFHR